jgi:hypothetical protein
MSIFISLIWGFPAFILAAFGFFVCLRYRHLSPWMWCILLGLTGILSKTGFEVVLLVISAIGGVGFDPQAIGGDILVGGVMGGLLSELAGWLGEMSVLLGVPMVIRELAGQFQLWKELQASAPVGMSD